MADIELAFGRGGLVVGLPDAARPTVIRKRPLPVPDDQSAAIEAALDNPIDVPMLSELAAGARSALVTVEGGEP